MLNHQPIMKAVKAFSGTYLVHSIFYTIQGEGPFCGQPAVFVRLAGCNLQCPWCDTEYTDGMIGAMTIDEILAAVKAAHGGRNCNLIVMTGGEPLRQPLGELLAEMVAERYRVQIETNGTLPFPETHGYLVTRDTLRASGVFIVCSPKTGVVHKSVAQLACCYKYVLDFDDGVNPKDGLPIRALGHIANPQLARPLESWRGPIYLQPADHKDAARNRTNIRMVTEAALEHGYTVQLQIHKYLGVE